MDKVANTQEPDQPTSAVETLAQWRERIFFAIFLSVLVFAFVPLVQSSLSSFQHQNWTLLFIHSVSYLSIVLIVLFRRIPFSIRVLIGLLILYGIGLTALVMIGPESSGRIWLFSFSIVATLLLGLRAGLTSIVINSLTVFAVGYLLSNSTLNWAVENSIHLKLWTITAVTFIFLNSVVTISLAVLVRALEKILVRSQYFTAKLQKANKELKESHGKRENLENQLIQAQKMESVGRLAGGVAHDYNNISSIIVGYSELILNSIEPNDSIYNDIKEIHGAAIRSTEITKQLLAFAKKQTIAPQVIDLAESVDTSLKMLKRLVGEDIDVSYKANEKIWPVKIDPSQLDQIMANLCVNARDAIQNVGKIVIGLENISLDQDYSSVNVGAEPGDYVLLSVADDGCGIAPENLEKIFDPFFTTKSLEKGTGLGLATVYGIAQQNNGFVHVYSELDRGTQFRVYLPRYFGEVEKCRDTFDTYMPLGKGEHILLAEDDSAILTLSERLLNDLGYHVLAASNPIEALALAEKQSKEIHLLMTDVIMPEMNGKELSEQLKKLFPGIKTLFVSGYTSNLIAHRGVLDDGVNFLSKPFSKNALAIKLRTVLE